MNSYALSVQVLIKITVDRGILHVNRVGSAVLKVTRHILTLTKHEVKYTEINGDNCIVKKVVKFLSIMEISLQDKQGFKMGVSLRLCVKDKSVS